MRRLWILILVLALAAIAAAAVAGPYFAKQQATGFVDLSGASPYNTFKPSLLSGRVVTAAVTISVWSYSSGDGWDKIYPTYGDSIRLEVGDVFNWQVPKKTTAVYITSAGGGTVNLYAE